MVKEDIKKNFKNIIKINLFLIISFLTLVLLISNVKAQENNYIKYNTYQFKFKQEHKKKEETVPYASYINITEEYTLKTYINKNKNEINKIAIDRENYAFLYDKHINVSVEETQDNTLKTLFLELKESLYYEDEQLFFKYNVINYKDQKRLTFLQKNTVIQENNKYFILKKDTEKITFKFYYTYVKGTRERDKTPQYSNLYGYYYISSIYNINYDKLLDFSSVYDYNGLKNKYKIINNNYISNESIKGDYKIELVYYDFTDKYRKYFDVNIKSYDTFNKYFIARKEFDKKDTFKIYVSNQYTLKEKDFNYIKDVLFNDKLIVKINKEKYKNSYLTDTQTLGMKYTIDAELINPDTSSSTKIEYEIETIDDAIFNNSSTQRQIKKTTKLFLNIVVSIFVLLFILILIFILFKIKKKVKRF